MMLFKKKPLSQELKLEQILLDIKNIAYANPNASLSQLRTFIDIYTNGVLIYENKESNLELVDKINAVKKLNLLTEDEINLMHQIRKTGNNAVHSYYHSREAVVTYYECCYNIYEKFIKKYESDRINYNKKLMRTYIYQIKEEKITNNKTDIPEIEKNYNGKLISESSVIVPEEDCNLVNLDGYETLKKRITKNISEVNLINKALEIVDEELEISKKKLQENKFNLVVLGEFNRGKSTFLNALLGKIILPSNILPTTSVITRISYGEEPKVKVTLNNGEIVYVPTEELVNYVTTLEGNDSTYIDITDVYLPTKLCENGCIITDTPGVNDLNEQNIVITENYIPHADAVIFIMDPDQVFTDSEKYFIKNKILKNDINKIFFIVNKFDSINKDGVNNFKKYVYSTLRELGLDSKVYFISSKKSLICKVRNIEDEYLKAFEEFSSELEKFLIEEKGKYLLLNGCNRLKNSIDKIILNIYEIEADIMKSIDKLEEDYSEFKKISDSVKVKKNNIMKDIDNKYFEFRNEVKKMVFDDLSLSFDNLIGELHNQAEFNETVFKDLENNINTNINRWINARVNPFVLSRVNQINEELTSLLSESLKYISKSKNYDICEQSKEIVVVESSKFELPSCYNTISTPTDDVNTFVGAGAIITMLLTGTLSSGIGGAFLGLIVHEMFGKKTSTTIKSKEEIIDSIENQKNKALKSIIRGIEDSIDKSYKQNCDYIEHSIQEILDNTSNRINFILNEKKKQNNDMEFVIDNLNSYLKKLYIIKKHNKLIIESLEG